MCLCLSGADWRSTWWQWKTIRYAAATLPVPCVRMCLCVHQCVCVYMLVGVVVRFRACAPSPVPPCDRVTAPGAATCGTRKLLMRYASSATKSRLVATTMVASEACVMSVSYACVMTVLLPACRDAARLPCHPRRLGHGGVPPRHRGHASQARREPHRPPQGKLPCVPVPWPTA